ncbi:hypothetical protein [Nitrospira sp. Nam74]
MNLAVKIKLIVGLSGQQPSLINARKRKIHPVVLERQQLADALARYMARIGLSAVLGRLRVSAIFSPKTPCLPPHNYTYHRPVD